MLPMYQSEALWLNFESSQIHDRWTEYPFAIKVATGKINAVTGDSWSDGLLRNPQDYMVSPGQPWIDGYCVEKGFIRQFVAMPLGSGYSAEEQLAGEAVHGGIQIVVYPMKRKVFEKKFPKLKEIKKMSKKYMIYYEKLTPIVWVNIVDFGVELTLRYLTEARKRRSSQDEICQMILSRFNKETDIDFAYPTYRIFKRGEKD